MTEKTLYILPFCPSCHKMSRTISLSAASSDVINKTPESRYNNIIDGTPLSGDDGVSSFSFLDFNALTESGLGILLGQYSTISAGKRGALLALKAQLSSQQGKSNS
jgi:hypothetical protein